jgi:hypothetical protein
LRGVLGCNRGCGCSTQSTAVQGEAVNESLSVPEAPQN